MFAGLNIHGGTGHILWGYHRAVVLIHWRVVKKTPTRTVKGFQQLAGKPEWQLSGIIGSVDTLPIETLSREAHLMFTAPREHGFWLWPVKVQTLRRVGPKNLVATLEPPEH